MRSPERIARLVLIGANPGIDDPAQRAERRRSDEAAGRRDRRHGASRRWLSRWSEQSLFADQPAEVRAVADEDRRRNSAAGLAAALRGFGTGVMAPVWDELGTLTMPVICAAGERDTKYRALSERLAALLPRGEAVTIRSAGHAAHLEQPEAVARLIAGSGA